MNAFQYIHFSINLAKAVKGLIFPPPPQQYRAVGRNKEGRKAGSCSVGTAPARDLLLSPNSKPATTPRRKGNKRVGGRKEEKLAGLLHHHASHSQLLPPADGSHPPSAPKPPSSRGQGSFPPGTRVAKPSTGAPIGLAGPPQSPRQPGPASGAKPPPFPSATHHAFLAEEAEEALVLLRGEQHGAHVGDPPRRRGLLLLLAVVHGGRRRRQAGTANPLRRLRSWL